MNWGWDGGGFAAPGIGDRGLGEQAAVACVRKVVRSHEAAVVIVIIIIIINSIILIILIIIIIIHFGSM